MIRKIKRITALCLMIAAMFITTAVHAGNREDALEILQCNEPYMHTVSSKTMEAWEAEDEQAVEYMDRTNDANKRGINKYSAAVQMFQKLYFPDDPSFSDTVEGRYMRDVFMTEGKLIPRIFHVMPVPGEIKSDEALSLALNEMRKKYNLNYADWTRNMKVDTHYFTPTGELKDAFWLFHAKLENGDQYAMRVTNGQVMVCQRLEHEEALYEAYTILCDEKGAFFKWSLEDKVNYAKQLPDAILEAYMEGQDLSRCGDLLAIARQGFSLPSKDVMSQADALEKAKQAVENSFSPAEGWDQKANINYSLYRKEDSFIWRVIFWKTGQKELPGAVVDMDAKTGVPFRVEKYDGTPESIPYVERL